MLPTPSTRRWMTARSAASPCGPTTAGLAPKAGATAGWIAAWTVIGTGTWIATAAAASASDVRRPEGHGLSQAAGFRRLFRHLDRYPKDGKNRRTLLDI